MTSAALSAGHPMHDAASASAEGDARYTAATTLPNVLVHLIQLALVRGLRCEPWFAGTGLAREQLNDPSLRVSYRQASTVIRRALHASGDCGLGLAVGRVETLGSFGLLGLAMMTSATFGEAMVVGITHHRVSGSLLDVSFEEVGPREVALAAWPRFNDAPLLPFLCEELFASSLAIARELLGQNFRPARLELTYARPPHADAYADFFQCELVFGARYNRIVLDVQWLEHPLPTHNPLTAQQARALCAQQHGPEGAPQEIVASVERLLRSHLHQQPRLPDVARMLNMSERSLRRRLAEGGRIFREIHDRVRAERALELLHGGKLSVAEIGQEIGFSDPREFRRAFKRWTGMPPRSARRQAA
ncbi:AraC family transcriptional regulator [Dyella sp. C9]|uniref:AraC family transcriptional regulator n=1 Tax=Dyella sp. C9 TaxID=2202154 RepID=UPI000DEFC1A0|nr:AraC family transcriptional regulator [Dyella sp. C9]